jgi:hypothetical protein
MDTAEKKADHAFRERQYEEDELREQAQAVKSLLKQVYAYRRRYRVGKTMRDRRDCISGLRLRGGSPGAAAWATVQPATGVDGHGARPRGRAPRPAA